MITLLEFNWHELLNPAFYIENGGLWLFLFIVFLFVIYAAKFGLLAWKVLLYLEAALNLLCNIGNLTFGLTICLI